MMTKEVEAIDPALVARMEAMLRRLADVDYNTTGQYFAKNTIENARTIVAELPKPVDPDLIEARKMAAANADHDRTKFYVESILSGEHDTSRYYGVSLALAAIKRGRELAQVSA